MDDANKIGGSGWLTLSGVIFRSQKLLVFEREQVACRVTKFIHSLLAYEILCCSDWLSPCLPLRNQYGFRFDLFVHGLKHMEAFLHHRPPFQRYHSQSLLAMFLWKLSEANYYLCRTVNWNPFRMMKLKQLRLYRLTVVLSRMLWMINPALECVHWTMTRYPWLEILHEVHHVLLRILKMLPIISAILKHPVRRLDLVRVRLQIAERFSWLCDLTRERFHHTCT